MQSNKDAENQSAPWFHLPDVPLVGVEHPYMISNIGRAIESLGGPLKVTKVKPFSLSPFLFMRPSHLFLACWRGVDNG